ncbi:MAG: lipocalin-like domain-containing protein [Rhodospirillales bacterium]|nr:lipocalin-like domain-containing protein [Rhodospirillales bacterium]
MIAAEDITGTWLLIERGASESAQGELLQRYGAQSEGMAIFSPDGWLSGIVCRSDRAPLPGNADWHADAPADARLAAFDSYVSYAGHWRVENDQLITKVRFALNPNWVGGEQVRDIELLADGKMRLVVTRVWPNGERVSVWLDWRRAD